MSINMIIENYPLSKTVNEDYVFGNYFVGKFNQLAVNAAKVICKEPGIVYNPLYIYGTSGVGKSFLLSAIANEIRTTTPSYQIVYFKGDDFTRELISSIREDHFEEFRHKVRNADVFILDDLQYIAGRSSAQEELFHTFNSLYETNKQIVLAADCTPRGMENLDEKLMLRFGSGLMVEIKPMDYTAKKEYLKSEAERLHLNLTEESFDEISRLTGDNAWDIRGVLRKISSFENLNHSSTELDLESIDSILEEYMHSQE